jgi:nucleotide-binding universal stress UspA family protein
VATRGYPGDDEQMTIETGERARVVVGVDGSPASQHALLWAARECRLRRCDLLIVHVASASGGDGDGQRGDGADRVRSMLEDSATFASGREPTVAVSTMLTLGPVSDRLVELSRSATLIVLGLTQAVARPLHGILGPVEDRVAAQAHCPVVTVNGPLQRTDRIRPRVVVGWIDNPSGHGALTAAAGEADARRGSLTVVSADLNTNPDTTQSGPPRGEVLSAALTELAESHKGLLIDTVYAPGDPAQALLRHSAGSDLLVVGCHHSGNRHSTRIGPVAAELIRSATCPVMLVGRTVASSRATHPATAASSQPHVLGSARLEPSPGVRSAEPPFGAS